MPAQPLRRGQRPLLLAAVSAALLALPAGCASAGGAGGSGGGGGWEGAREWGCDPAEVQRDFAESGSPMVEPQVGWSACQLLALHGAPSESRRVENPGGDTWLLFFRTTPGATRMVTLRQDATDDWRVSAVVSGGGG